MWHPDKVDAWPDDVKGIRFGAIAAAIVCAKTETRQEGVAQAQEHHDMLWIALRRLVVRAWEFQRMAQNFDETDTTDDFLTQARDLATEALQHTCPHLEWKGTDTTPLQDPQKQWTCTRCDVSRHDPVRQEPGEGTDDPGQYGHDRDY